VRSIPTIFSTMHNETTGNFDSSLTSRLLESRGYSATSTNYSTDYSSIHKETLDYDRPLTVDGDDANSTDTFPDELIPKTSAGQTYIHLLKGYLGPGCLSLPWAISQLGFLWGSIAIAVMSMWSSYNCMTIVKMKRYIERVNMHNTTVAETESRSESSSVASSALTYPNVGEWAFGENFERFVSGCVCTQQLAICTVFFSFIGENIYAVCDLVPEILPAALMSHIGVMTVALPFIMGLSFIPSLDALTPILAAGTVLLFVSFGVLAYVITLVWDDRPIETIAFQWKSAPLALCAILYSYEGICLILPIESSMAKPRKFRKVFWQAMTSIALILATVSNICVYSFGEVTNGSITAFLLERYKEDSLVILFVMIANVAVSLSVLFTYPIQIFPVIEILGPEFSQMWLKLMAGYKMAVIDEDNEHDLTGFEPMPPLPEHDVAENESEIENFKLSNYGDNDTSNDDKERGHESPPEHSLDLRSSIISNITEIFPQFFVQNSNLVLRILLVLLTYGVAVAVPNVQALISLAGAIAGSGSALLIPPMLELALIEHAESSSSELNVSSSPKLLPCLSVKQPNFIWKLMQHNISGKHRKKKMRCYILFWLGFVFFLIGTAASLWNIVMIWVATN